MSCFEKCQMTVFGKNETNLVRFYDFLELA